MQCADFSAEQLQEAVKNGYTLVATDEHGTLMGMLSILIRNVNRWWYHGRAAYVAVAPEFKGHGVYRCLSHTAVEMIKREGVSVQYLNTHVDNVSARLAYEKDGYRCVRFYQVVARTTTPLKWLSGLIVKRKTNCLCSDISFK